MLKLKPSPTFPHTLRLSVPGQAEPVELAVVFRHRGKKDLQDWMRTLGDKSDAVAALEILESWEGVVDTDGTPVPLSAAALDALFDGYPGAPLEITEQYFEALRGGRRKN